MADNHQQTLADAVARNLGAVVSLPSAGMLRHRKSRFLESTDQSIILEAVSGEKNLIEELIASGNLAGVSFKNGQQSVMFAAPVLQYLPEHRVNATLTVEALVLGPPVQFKAVQRRTCYRVTVPLDSDLKARLWRMGRNADLADKPMAAQEISGQLHDLSVGGLGMVLSAVNGQFPRVVLAERIRISLEHPELNLLLEGYVRFAPDPKSPSPRLGVQFTDMQTGMEGRKSLATLTRIVGELQREEARRFRRGLAKSA